MKIQASSIHRITNCPQSLQLDNQLPDGFRNNFKTFAATFGHDMHEIAEKQLQAFINKKRISTTRKMIIDKGFAKDTVDFDKGFKAVDTYVKHVKKVINKYKKKQGFNVLIEEKFKFKYGQYTLVAKMDCLLSYKEKDIITIHIFDLKTGVWDYSKSAYDQMIYTVLLYLYITFPKNRNFNIMVHTIQPNYYIDNLKIVMEGRIILDKTPKTLLNEFLYPIHENNRCQKGSYCRFCPVLLLCPDIIKSINEIKSRRIL